jgi:hypothetical protein
MTLVPGKSLRNRRFPVLSVARSKPAFSTVDVRAYPTIIQVQDGADLRPGRTFTASPGTVKCRAVIMQNRGPVYQEPHTFNLSLTRSLTAPHTSFAGRRQNRVQERPADPAGEAGGSAGDNLVAAFGGPIAFFTLNRPIT